MVTYLIRSTAWDLSVVSPVCVPLSPPVSVGRLYFIAKCSTIDLLVNYNFIKKQNLQKVYPAETNLILSLAMTSIFVVHIYACSNTISWQLLYLCCVINVVLGLYFFFVLSNFFFLLFCFTLYFLFSFSLRHSGWLYAQAWKSKSFFFCCCCFYFLLVCTVTPRSVSELLTVLVSGCSTSCGHLPWISVVLLCLFLFSFFFFLVFKSFFLCCISRELVPQLCL